jgi:hypothetical protein
MTEKKEEKKPLDLTTEEAVSQLFPQEAIDHLKHVAREADEKKEAVERSAKSSRKHSNR